MTEKEIDELKTVEIRKKIILLRETKAVMDNVAKDLSILIEDNPQFNITFTYPVGETYYSIDLDQFREGIITATILTEV